MSQEQGEHHAATVRKSLPRNILFDAVARVLYLLTRLAVPPFILAHVGLAEYGLWTTAFILVSYIGISTMGLSSVYVKCVAEFAAKSEFERANRLLSTGLVLTVPACIALFFGTLLLWPTVSVWLHIAPALTARAREVVLSVVGIFLASLSLSVFRDALVAVQKTAEVQTIWIFTFTVETVLIFLLVANGRGIRGLAEAFVLRTILEILISAYLAFRLLPWLKISIWPLDQSSLHLLFKFGGTVQILSILAVALNSIERAVAAPLAGMTATALLDLAKKVPAMAASVPLAFASSLAPAASFLHGGLEGSEEQKGTIQRLYCRGARYMSLSSGLALALPACLSFWILHVWMGKDYAGAALLMTVFGLSAQANLLTGPGTSILRGIGKYKEEYYYALPNLALLVVALPLSRLILHQWTAVGIGSAVAGSTVLAAAIFLARAHRLLHVSLASYTKQVLAPGFVPFVAALPLAVVSSLLFPHLNRWSGACALAGLAVVYAVLAAAAIGGFVLDVEERNWLRAAVFAKLGRLGGTPKLLHTPGC